MKISGSILDKYLGKYSPAPQGGSFQITKEGDLLKIADTNFSTFLYPISENRFFLYERETAYEIEFTGEPSGQVSKLKVFINGNAVFESKKLN